MCVISYFFLSKDKQKKKKKKKKKKNLHPEIRVLTWLRKAKRITPTPHSPKQD